MLLQIFGLLDVVIGVSAVLMAFGLYWKAFILGAGIYLIAKGLLFIRSIASILDIAAGALLLIGLFVVLPKQVFFILALVIVQKGIFSFL